MKNHLIEKKISLKDLMASGFKIKVSLVVAHGKNGELGLNNKLLWHIQEDLKHFKNITNDKHLFMGRNTYDSIIEYLKKPLPNRISLVLTNRELNGFVNESKVNSFEEALQKVYEDYAEELIIIGGAKIYKDYFSKADTLYITEVDYEGEADCYFKEDLSNFELKEEATFQGYKFKKYERIQ